MDKIEIYFGVNCVGWASLEKEGLYYRISCKCNMTEKSIFRVIMASANGRYPIGVLLPAAPGFALSARIPVKKVDLNTLHFMVEPLDSDEGCIRIPISADLELPWLQQLENARLHYHNGSKILVIKQNVVSQ